MKYTNRELSHAWIHRTSNNESGNGSNFFYEGDTLYSYGNHFACAKDYGDFVLVNISNYSATTSKHMSYTRQALTHKTTHEVDNPAAYSKAEHQSNYSDLKARIERVQKQIVRGRDGTQAQNYRYTDLETLIRTANFYTRQFKLGYRQIPLDFSNDKKESIKRAITAEKVKQDRQAKKYLAEWVNTGANRYKVSQSDIIYCRINDSTQMIETSHGASFPVTDAPLIWKAVTRARKHKKAWVSSHDSDFKAGMYRINKISKTGTLTAGCHTVKYAQMLPIAKQLELEV
jgi:hypothetical protein